MPTVGYAVQLSSLRDEAAARREWARLSEELAEVLGDTELTVEAGTVSAIPLLGKVFEDKEASVRQHAALMLRKIGHRSAVPARRGTTGAPPSKTRASMASASCG